MSKNPLFSTYRQGENRVTSSMLAVFERIDLALLEHLLAAASGESALQTVTFVNQPPGQGASVPDGCIAAHFAYWFEVKTTRDGVRKEQLRQHLKNLPDSGGDQRLFVVTPDAATPEAIKAIRDPRVLWFSFAALSDAIEAALSETRNLVSEQARFLLRELQALLTVDGLVDTDDVVVVAARDAHPEYREVAAYVCQAGRAFRSGLTHMGFYAAGQIQVELPAILGREDDVIFSRSEARRRRRRGRDRDRGIAALIETLLDNGTRVEGQAYQVFLLTPIGDPRTVRLETPIQSDTRTESGRPWAWTLGQRYAKLSRLTAPGVRFTSQLEP